jgi:hypothetical protein
VAQEYKAFDLYTRKILLLYTQLHMD